MKLVKGVLTREESAEYERLGKMELRWANAGASVVAFLVWLLALVGSAYLLSVNDTTPPAPQPVWPLVLLMLVMFGGWPLLFWFLAVETRAQRTKMQADYLVRIKYVQRVKEQEESTAYWNSVGSRSSDAIYKSQRQINHEWYGDHSELNWRDRETAQMYGMDVETYLSNYLND